MTREELEAASDLLAEAADTAERADADRLVDLADQLDHLSEAEEGPDHGRLARIQNALGELEDAATDEVQDTIESAHDHVREYRRGVEGV